MLIIIGDESHYVKDIQTGYRYAKQMYWVTGCVGMILLWVALHFLGNQEVLSFATSSDASDVALLTISGTGGAVFVVGFLHWLKIALHLRKMLPRRWPLITR
jgi:hypothetical protein